MGKGDKKTKKGKIVMGTFGVSRRKKKKTSMTPVVAKKSKPRKKATSKK